MIEVGEYVRTKKQGIRRIDTIFKNKTVNKYGYEIGSEWDGILYSTIKTTDIIKHSKNIIDLIEVGDYVNGHKVGRVHEVPNEKIGKVIDTDIDDYICWEMEPITIYKEDIKTILTKEQYEANCYKLKEEIC